MPTPEQPIQENLADIKKPATTEGGIEIAKTKELESVVNAANNLAEKIKGDKNVTDGDVTNLEETLGRMKFDVFGKQMTLEEIRMPEIKENILIWKEMERGDFSNVEKLTNLPKKVAAFLRQFKEHNLNLNHLASIPAETLKTIRAWGGDNLSLNGLVALNKQEAHYMTQWEGDSLSLGGLSELPEDCAQVLKEWGGKYLSLGGIAHIPMNSMRALKDWKRGEWLTLGLTSLTEGNALYLKQWTGNSSRRLSLQRLKTLSPAVAFILKDWQIEHEDWLNDLDLSGLTSLSEKTSRYLSQWKGKMLELNGISSLTDDVALNLRNWQGDELSLNGLTVLSESVAKILSEFSGTLFVPKSIEEQINKYKTK